MRRLYRRQIFQMGIGAVSIGVLWELVPRLFRVEASVLPTFSAVIGTISGKHSLLLKHVAETAEEAVAAFVVAVVLAAVFAVIIVEWRTARLFLLHPVLAIQNVPKVALAPLLVLWFAHGMVPKIAMGALIAFFPIFEGFRVGLETDRTGLRRTFSVLNPGRWKTLWLVKFPEAAPNIASGCRVGITFATIGAIVGELAQPSSGLGFLIEQGKENYQTELQFAAVFLVSVLGLALYGVLVLVEQSPWIRRYLRLSAVEQGETTGA